ncbi:MAG: HgcAB-like fusion protein [Myxococcota bacterium]
MSAIKNILQCIFRMLPWPTETGLRSVGQPGRKSPVLVTCNYDLTVRRLQAALEGIDAWIVVAPSSGVNVWCAAAGGHFGTHQVVTALKTSGVAEVVDHRRAILPQLAATGVERLELKRRCGWNASFGPVRAEDLPEYLARDQQKNDPMRQVRFGAFERIEMAIAWGGPAALILAGTAVFVRPGWALPLAALALGLAGGVFFTYERIPGPRRSLFLAASVVASLAVVLIAGGSTAALVTGGLAAASLSVLLTYDYAGSTPIEGGSHFDERRFEIRLDLDRCKGVYSCWEVCPEACFEKPEPDSGVEVERAQADRKGRRPISLAHDDRCVRCGACIVQCPLDALAFETPDGERIEPDVIRRFKLNLIGSRTVASRHD